MRILLVDDEEIILRGMTRLLDILQHTCVCVSNGQEALQVIEGQPVDLVISDIQMPRMDGFQLVRAIRDIRPELPIILLTGAIVDGMEEEGARQGIYAIYRKPVKFVDLEQAVKKIEEGNRESST